MFAVKGNTRMLAQRVEAGQLAMSMPVAAANSKPAKLAPLLDEKALRALRALPVARLQKMCEERGLAAGWCKAASVGMCVAKLLALSK